MAMLSQLGMNLPSIYFKKLIYANRLTDNAFSALCTYYGSVEAMWEQ